MQLKLFRGTLILISGVLGFAAGAAGQDITPTERSQAIRYLVQTREGLIRSIKGLSVTQWKFKPAADRWSAAEVLEHIALTEDVVLANVLPHLAGGPAPAKGVDPRPIDAMILSKVPDRSTKLQAPEILVPAGRWSPHEAHVVPHPALGPLDGYQWILAVAAHTERHTRQILEVEADPHFPSGPLPRNTN